jgi:two-component system sensor histidine kinase PilS (NtrC family)
MLDTGVTLGSGETQVKVRPRFISTELRRAGDTVVFLEDLRQAQSRAQQLKLAALGRLTANIAHEIRNPLSAVRQAAQLLHENAPEGDVTRTRLTDMIEKNVKRIDRIVTNVLSLSKRDRVVTQTLELAPLLSELIGEWCESSQVERTKLMLTCENGVRISADRGHFEEIVWNILTNGWRHSAKKSGSVRVAARRGTSGRTAVVEITDDGPGVPADHRESIFEPFFSLSGSSGLGLYISRELAESNGGSLELTNHQPGAQFRLMVPALNDSEFQEP